MEVNIVMGSRIARKDGWYVRKPVQPRLGLSEGHLLVTESPAIIVKSAASAESCNNDSDRRNWANSVRNLRVCATRDCHLSTELRVNPPGDNYSPHHC